MRAAGTFILASVAGFVVLAAAAMWQYPGGSWLDLRAHGHDFWRNFLCDLLGPEGLNRQPNPLGSKLMLAAMLVMAAGLAVTWWAIPRLLHQPRLGRALQVSGAVSMVGLVAVPLTPPTVSYAWHAAAVFGGGVPALLAWTLGVVGFWREPGASGLALLGAAALASIAVALGLYALAVGDTAHPNLLLPGSHRVATAFFLAWVSAIGLALRRRRG